MIRTTFWMIAFFMAQAVSAQGQFAIEVLDTQAGRGVPLVEIRAGGQTFVTDSNGLVAIDDPALLNRVVDFDFSSYGYTGFSQPVQTFAGQTRQISIDRINRAERLYRATGTGIYQESVQLGRPVPIDEPLLDSNVKGSDSVQSIQYKGQVRWFWGDTLFEQPAGPFIGVFRIAGATTPLPGAPGGPDPNVGINYDYFVNPVNGYVRQMMPITDPGPVWLDGLFTAHDGQGEERMLGRFTRVQTLGVNYEQGLALYNDATDEFERFLPYALDAPIAPKGHSFRHTVDGQEYIYFAEDYPNVRVRADWDHITDITKWEAYTPFPSGTRYDPNNVQLVTDTAGDPVFAWRTGTDPLTSHIADQLVQAGHLDRSDSPYRLRDHETGTPISLHRASVYWNAYRQSWMMVGNQWCGPGFANCGDSTLGEVWYAEAPTPEGPWEDAVKVASHAGPGGDYSFYNPKIQPFFNEEEGKVIYFEGTYSHTFSTASPTPLYDYNQMMYRLDLSTLPNLIDRQGDYNNDGRVDAADYTVWRDALGTTGFSLADGDRNGVVDAADYALWRDRYESATQPATATPEPTGVMLLALMLGAAAVRNR